MAGGMEGADFDVEAGMAADAGTSAGTGPRTAAKRRPGAGNDLVAAGLAAAACRVPCTA